MIYVFKQTQRDHLGGAFFVGWAVGNAFLKSLQEIGRVVTHTFRGEELGLKISLARYGAGREYVEVDDVICVIETDKVSVDIRSDTAGAVETLLAAEEDTVEVGAPIAKLDTAAAKPEGGLAWPHFAPPRSPSPPLSEGRTPPGVSQGGGSPNRDRGPPPFAIPAGDAAAHGAGWRPRWPASRQW